ncbi:MAG: TOBE domain-containing protein [Methylococcaceae bacterium]|nr:TOBE domain-containing protein [Methylococcaceae bacterium]
MSNIFNMAKKQNGNIPPMWVEGELRLAGALDNRIIGLLTAIQKTGSLNQAAKQLGLSYKGAWQILERTNNSAPKILVTTATGGSKGGGSCLTDAGQALLALFTRLEQQHQHFLEQLNRDLANNPDMVLLLQRLVVKTSARNQLFGRVTDIRAGSVNAEVMVQLKGGETIVTTTDLSLLTELELKIGVDAVLLINSADITLVVEANSHQFSARNHLACHVLSIQQTAANVEVIVLLPSGETLIANIVPESLENLKLSIGKPVWVIFKANVPYLGIRE